MWLRRNATCIERPLKLVPVNLSVRSSCSCRNFSDHTVTTPQDVAVLGGGITGLATAYFLSKGLPNARIAIYETNPKVGGWLQSEHVDVPGGRVLFEHGPRTIRPSAAALVTAKLIEELGLVEDTIYTSKTAPSARNRYIYYPDHLVRMPAPGAPILRSLTSLLSEPLFRGSIAGVLGEPFRPKRPSTLTDESVGSFISRRIGKDIADNLASAVLHGIYAGDAYQLSARTLFPVQWRWEKEYGSLIKGAMQMIAGQQAQMTRRDVEYIKDIKKEPLDKDFEQALAASSVFTFRNGIQQLVNRLETILRTNENVTIHTNAPVKALLKDSATGKLKIITGDSDRRTIKDQVVSTIFAKKLAAICKDSTGSQETLLPSLAGFHAVTVMVVNFYFSNPDLLPNQGFGYLIPRSIPFEQNPERALGIIFDSDAVKGQDTADGTKVTVMLGGHWWDGWPSYPSADEGIAMARTVLARHLNISEEPTAARANLQKNCIPQYTIGHEERLQSAHRELIKAYGGRLRVAGNSYNGVGVNDCLRAARDVAKGVAETKVTLRTGLEHFMEEQVWERIVINQSGADGEDT